MWFDGTAANCANFTIGKPLGTCGISGVGSESLLTRLSFVSFHPHPHRKGISHRTGSPCVSVSSSTSFTFSAADRVQDDRKMTFATVHNLPPLSSWKDPWEERFDNVISRLWRKPYFSDVIYLVLCWHPVMMTCHSSLLCTLYLYMIRLLFHCIALDLSPILLCHTCN